MSSGVRESRLVRRGLLIGLAASFLALLFGPREALSAFAGAMISVANLRVLKTIAEGAAGLAGGRAALIAAALTGLRYALLGALLFVIIAVWEASVLGVIAGLGAPLGAVVLELFGEGRNLSRGSGQERETAAKPESEADRA